MIGPCSDKEGVPMICWLPHSKLCLRAKNLLLFTAICISSCAISGCLDSTWYLASDSRLPRWFTLPPGLTRKDVSVEFEFYVPLRGDPNSKCVLRDKKRKVLAEVKFKNEGNKFVVNGITETIGYAGVIIDHGPPESIFYFDDNPAIKQFYGGLPICSKNYKEMSKKWTGGPCRYRG
jgi:hypothetical protein